MYVTRLYSIWYSNWHASFTRLVHIASRIKTNLILENFEPFGWFQRNYHYCPYRERVRETGRESDKLGYMTSAELRVQRMQFLLVCIGLVRAMRDETSSQNLLKWDVFINKDYLPLLHLIPIWQVPYQKLYNGLCFFFHIAFLWWDGSKYLKYFFTIKSFCTGANLILFKGFKKVAMCTSSYS